MRSALSLALMICVLASELPVTAQDWVGTQASTDWSRMRKLTPGTEIVVTAKGAEPGQRYLVTTDDSELTVLNLTDPALPRDASKVLFDVASSHPEYFPAAREGRRFVFEKRVRVGPDGVFVGGTKVADLTEVEERFAQGDLAEVSIRQRGRGVWGHLGLVGGYFVGALSGGFIVGLICRSASGPSPCDSGALLVGVLGGGIAGAAYGFRAAIRETEDVIYRAP